MSISKNKTPARLGGGQAFRWLNIGRQGIPTISANLIERTQDIAASPEVNNESTL
jgi:hypothetical protein